MTYLLTAQDAEFRDTVRSFLASELPDDLRQAGRRCAGIFTDYPDAIRWHRILAGRGWSVPHWPIEHGGTGWTPMQHYIFATELAAADAPPLAPMSTHMVAPVILAFGTEEQKQRWLPAIRAGDDYWAQGYSEPQAGSDLASLQCRAVRDGDDYVINGTKIWTTHAQWANRMFCLVRTESGGKSQRGISFLLFDLKLPGITIRPIISISGDHELNQVFFDDVRVPASALLGDENQGWTIAKYLLQHERGHAWAPLLRARMRRLRAMLAAAHVNDASDDFTHTDMLRKLADAECGIDAVEAMELRALHAQSQGKPPGITPSMGKVLGAELRQKMTELAVELGGHYAAARPDLDALGLPGDAMPEESVLGMSMYLNDRAASIYAHTNDIMRNIVAAHLLANRESGASEPHGYTESQNMMVDALARFLRERYPFETHRRMLQSGAGWSPALWSGFANELGILGASFAGSLGGMGGGTPDNLLIAAELGPALAAEPWLSTVAIGGGFLNAAGGALASELSSAIIEGDAMLAFAYAETQGRHDLADLRATLTRDGDAYLLNGHKAAVRGAQWATHLIVTARSAGGQRDRDGVSVVVIDSAAAGIRSRSYPTIDGGCASEVWFDNVRVPRNALLAAEGAALPLLERVVDGAIVTLCAEAVGIMRRLLRDTIDYATQRKQFGASISSFQVMQHRMADMLMHCEQADAVTQMTALKMDLPHDERGRAVSSAKVTIAKACHAVGQSAVQVHGAMGMTDELAVGHFFKRLTVIEGLFGGVDFHLRRVDRLARGRA